MVDRSAGKDPLSARGESLNACDLEALQQQRIQEAGYQEPRKMYRQPWTAVDEKGDRVQVPKEVYYP